MRRLLLALLAVAQLSGCGSSDSRPAKTPVAGGDASRASGAEVPAGANGNRFFSPVAGVSVEKRPSWVFGTLESELANRRAVSVGREETDAVMHEGKTPPLVVIARYEEPSAKPNPTLKINLRELGEVHGASALAITRAVADAMAKAIPSFELEGAVQATHLSGLDAGTFRAHFTLEVPDLARSFDIKTQAWIVPRGDHVFIIAASDPSEGAEDFEADFQAMVATIVIRK